ncbi:MAG: 16S rRNA (guanine(966)-N(2))-methyltransferase RsmD [Rhodoferax sp.]|nr:16S rRNA (guanine(966)-N(2))-methyltransferase RsmD [Rhodoferax sp.]
MAKIDAARTRQATAGPGRPKPVKRLEPSDHQVRIVGGRWKRSRLPVANKAGLRPTPDRVRETVFNWLGQDLSGWSCLDAFAGTGALGFEAASRGATAVTLVENDRELVLQLAASKERLGADMVQIHRGDGVAAIARLPAHSLDLVFLDPPFDANLFEPALRAAAGVIRSTAFVYLEAPVAWTDAMLGAWGLTVVRHLKAGAVHAHLLQISGQPPHA